MTKALLVKDSDNVATSLDRLTRGEQVTLGEGAAALDVQLAEDIAFGHKFAVRAIAAGEPILKYAETIGLATRAIAPGEWVHVHNVESVRARGDRAPGGSR